MPYLDHWAKDAKPSKQWNVNKITEAERKRLRKALALVLGAVAVPRRLGGDASDGELAQDKQLARALEHRLRVVLGWWGEHEVEVEPNRRGASVVWSDWLQDYQAELRRRMQVAAATALAWDRRDEGNTIVHRYERELNYVRGL